VTGQTPGLPVVDADIGEARDVLDIGCQRHHMGAKGGKGADRLAHQRVILGDDADTPGLTAQGQQAGGKGLGIEPLDPFDGDGQIGAGGGVRLDLAVQAVHEGIGAGGQQKGQGDLVGHRVGDVAKTPGGFQHDVLGPSPHAIAAIQHAVHRRRRQPGRLSDILQCDAGGQHRRFGHRAFPWDFCCCGIERRKCK